MHEVAAIAESSVFKLTISLFSFVALALRR